MRHPTVVLLVAILLPLSLLSQQRPMALTNKDVLEMLNAGLSAEVVLAKINSAACDFNTSPDALKSLKAASVPDQIILAMVHAPASSSSGSVGYVKCGVGGTEVYLLSSVSNSTTMETLKCGDQVALLSNQNGYYRARTTGGTEGYISHYFVSDEKENPSPAAPPNAGTVSSAMQPQAHSEGAKLPYNMLRVFSAGFVGH